MKKKTQKLSHAKSQYSLALIVTMTAALITSCAKDRPYEVLEKSVDLQQLGSLSQAGQIIDGKVTKRAGVENLYVSNTQGTARFNAAVSPYVQGTERAIELYFTEEGLVGYEMEQDKSFNDNIHNNDPIFTIPVSYKSFRCRENADKECTNIEEENTDADVEWFQKNHYIPDFAAIELHERDTLRVTNSCMSESSSKLAHYEVNDKNIYFEINKTYKFNVNNWRCISWLAGNITSWDEYSRLLDEMDTVSTTLSFSIARMDAITTPGYQAIKYEKRDQRIFGFFPTSISKKDDNQRKYQDTLVNRWSPKRNGGVIQYYMSKEFNKPENKFLKDATYVAFDNMNSALKEGGVNFRVKIDALTKEQEETIRPGDMRYSMIVLIEDIASGLLGYGPSVANPRTGEIVKAHTNMYKGSLKGSAPRMYRGVRDYEEGIRKSFNKTLAVTGSDVRLTPDDVVLADKQKIKALAQNMVNSQANIKAHTPQANLEFNKSTQIHLKSHKGFKPLPSLDNLKKHLEPKSVFSDDHVERIGQLEVNPRYLIQAKSKLVDFIEGQMGDSSFVPNFNNKSSQLVASLSWAIDDYSKYESGLKQFAEQNMYHEDMMNYQALGKIGVQSLNGIEGLRYGDEAGINTGKLKPWDQLDEELQEIVTEKLVIHSYIPTLVHEIGHNLGLRHNFAGSYDKANYYTEEKRKALGIAGGAPYSSIMDYNYSALNSVSTFGPYDIAAFRFAYNRDVQTESGSYVKINDDGSTPLIDHLIASFQDQNPATNIKMFTYCTDQNRGTMNCDVFDEGGSFLELTKHYVSKHKEWYALRNTKGNRKRFSEHGNVRGLIQSFFSLSNLRRIHEAWQFYYTTYGPIFVTGCNTPALEQQYGQNCSFINEIVEANELAGDSLMEIVKTQDLTCDVVYSATLDGKEIAKNERAFVNAAMNLNNIQGILANDDGYYRPHHCFDESMKPFLDAYVLQLNLPRVCQAQGISEEKCREAKVTSKAVGQTGLSHNDVDAAAREDEDMYQSDIEIRGMWPEKMIALHFLTHNANIVSAGANRHMSFLNHPKYLNEISNMIDHLAFGAPLRGQTPYVSEAGVEYYPMRRVTLDINTKVYPYISDVMGMFVPTSSTGDFNRQTGTYAESYGIGKYLLKQIASSTRPVGGNYDVAASAQRWAMHNAITASFLATDKTRSSFGTDIKKTYNFPGLNLKVGATDQNIIAAQMIDILNGEFDEEANKVVEIVNKLNFPQTSAPTPSDSAEEMLQEVAAQEAVSTGKGIELFNKVMKYKIESYMNGYDYMLLDQAVTNAQENAQSQQEVQQLINIGFQKAFQSMGEQRYQTALELLNANRLPSGDENEEALKSFSVSVLEYATLNAEQRAAYKNQIANNLRALQPNGTRNFSWLFYFRSAQDEQE